MQQRIKIALNLLNLLMRWKPTIGCQRMEKFFFPCPYILLIFLYKKDMMAILQYLAEIEGMATSYDDRTPAARKKRAVKANAA